MAVEIERKFLVNDVFSIKMLNSKPIDIWQVYLLREKNRSIRLRKKGEKAFITIKTGTDLLSRSEYEYEIPLSDFEEMKLNLKGAFFIEKKRYNIKFDGLIWEVDVFEGKNKGLVLAEVELEYAFQKFKKPDWIGREVTNNPNYLNSYLAEHPFLFWKNQL